MERREFLGWMGVGCVASSLVACNNQTPSPTGAAEFLPVGTVAELDQQGYILNEKFAGGSVIVVKDSANPQQIKALNPTCSHAGCTVNWNKDEKSLICPCHDSKFASDGKVIQGPAKDPLPVYEAKLDGDKILVKKA